MSGKIEVGDKAPVFKLYSQEGNETDIGEILGNRPLVLFFYPKNNTTVCTKEACEFRNSYKELAKINGAEVIGISSDSTESHKNFASEHNLPYTLLSDPDGAVRKLYGVPKTLGLLPGRVTYVIDRSGIVRSIFSSQLDYRGHVEEALTTLRAIEQGNN